jgi:hypothetical protein
MLVFYDAKTKKCSLGAMVSTVAAGNASIIVERLLQLRYNFRSAWFRLFRS